MNMKTTLPIGLLTAVLILATGCFEIRGEHTLYLDPGGALTWTVVERDIRFDEQDPKLRARAIDDLLRHVAEGTNDASRALGRLAPATLEARVLRDEPPLAIRTDARFPAIDDVYRNLLAIYGLTADAGLESDGGITRLRVTVWPAEVQDVPPGDPAEMLLALLLECRIVLTEGTFVESRGFEIADDGTVAIPEDPVEEEGKPTVLELAWTTAAAEPGRED